MVPDDLEREYHPVKSCAPLCTVGCVHRVAQVDELRQDPEAGTVAVVRAARADGQRPQLPPAIRMLQWAFVTNPRRDLFRRAAARLFRPARPRDS